MAQFGPTPSARNATPMPPTGVTVASFDTYLGAQRAVDYLSDQHFPVQMVTIVGTDLKMVERVTGRLTWARVAMMGAASGAWFGIFVGLLLTLFGGRGEGILGQSLLTAVGLGAGFGMLFGLLSYGMSGGRRDFTSTSQVVASTYSILCQDSAAGQAREVLAGLTLNPEHGRGGVVSSSEQAGVTFSPPAASQPGWAPSNGVPPQVGNVQPTGAVTAKGHENPVPVHGPTYGEMLDRKKAEAKRESLGDKPAGPND